MTTNHKLFEDLETFKSHLIGLGSKFLQLVDLIHGPVPLSGLFTGRNRCIETQHVNMLVTVELQALQSGLPHATLFLATKNASGSEICPKRISLCLSYQALS